MPQRAQLPAPILRRESAVTGNTPVALAQFVRLQGPKCLGVLAQSNPWAGTLQQWVVCRGGRVPGAAAVAESARQRDGSVEQATAHASVAVAFFVFLWGRHGGLWGAVWSGLCIKPGSVDLGACVQEPWVSGAPCSSPGGLEATLENQAGGCRAEHATIRASTSQG